jgi:CRP-like cAMP-binding protein
MEGSRTSPWRGRLFASSALVVLIAVTVLVLNVDRFRDRLFTSQGAQEAKTGLLRH